MSPREKDVAGKLAENALQMKSLRAVFAGHGEQYIFSHQTDTWTLQSKMKPSDQIFSKHKINLARFRSKSKREEKGISFILHETH